MNHSTLSSLPSLPAADRRLRFIGSFTFRLAFGELKIERFGSASHVAISYDVETDRGPRVEFGWLPYPAFVAASISS